MLLEQRLKLQVVADRAVAWHETHTSEVLRQRAECFRRMRALAQDVFVAAIQPPTSFISGSFIPRVVTAGVPRRIPLGLNGVFTSKGMVLRLVVTPASSSAVCASLPLTPSRNTSISIKWLSVPPETRRSPSDVSAAAKARALATTCVW